MKLSILTIGLLFASISASAANFTGSLSATFLISENNQVRRSSGTCTVKAVIDETAEAFKISSSSFQCGEISWSDSKSLFKRDGVLYDRLGVAIGNHYASGTLQFPTTTSKDFEYTESVFDRNCKIVAQKSRRLQLTQTVVYAFQPSANGYSLSIEMYWGKPQRTKPASSCAGAEAWSLVEDQARIKGTLQAL